MQDWRPGASNRLLQLRAELNRAIREFFYQRQVLEVETPVLCQAPVIDPNIEPIQAQGRYLHTSPEYAMKRLLCADSGDIFQIAKVFRCGEAGQRHNPEFSMLEWYRVDWDHWQLMDEVAELLRLIFKQSFPRLDLSYTDALRQFAQIKWADCDDGAVRAKGIELAGADLELDRDGWLDIIMSHQVEPNLPQDTLVFIYDYPPSQAALSKVRVDESSAHAERFEVFLNGVELANGYHELTDHQEQKKRFFDESKGRDIDQRLLQAMASGMPECAGVAMGLDRILMLLTGLEFIDEVVSFSWDRA